MLILVYQKTGIHLNDIDCYFYVNPLSTACQIESLFSTEIPMKYLPILYFKNKSLYHLIQKTCRVPAKFKLSLVRKSTKKLNQKR